MKGNEQSLLLDEDPPEQDNLPQLEAALRCRAKICRYTGEEEIHYEGEPFGVRFLALGPVRCSD